MAIPLSIFNIRCLQFFQGHDKPIVFPAKEAAGDNESSLEDTQYLSSLETQSDPIIPSQSPFDDADASSSNAEISKSDSCVGGSTSEIFMLDNVNGFNLIDGSNNELDTRKPEKADDLHTPKMGYENSAFTKVPSSKQPLATNEVSEVLNVEETPLVISAAEGAEGLPLTDVPDPIFLGDNTGEFVNTLFCEEDLLQSSELEEQEEILYNADTINVPLSNTHGSTSPVSGNIPPHNTPVIGSNKGEVNLVDLRLALTQVFDNEQEDEQPHMDNNSHDFRRSVSADVYHEKDKEHGSRLRHNSGT